MDLISYEMRDINPWIPRSDLKPKIDEAAWTLYNMHPAYFGQSWFQKYITGKTSPMEPWSSADKNGDRFLSVAKPVWIR